MTLYTRLFLLLLALGGAVLSTGCSITSEKDSSIPWNRPADWEGQIPGMENPGSGANQH